MFQKVYPPPGGSLTNNLSDAFFCLYVAIILIVLISFAIRLPGIKKKITMIILSILLFIGSYSYKQINSKSENKHKLEVEGNVVIMRECSFLAGTIPGEFSVGGEKFEFGPNTHNYEIIDIIKNAKSGDLFRINFDKNKFITEIWLWKKSL